MDDPDDDTLELSPIARLVAEGIERLERGERNVVERLCAEHPDQAEALRTRFERLATRQLLEAPRAYGPYRVLRVLGRGGMGVVHLARDERLGRLVALKVLPTGVGGPRLAERFRREVAAIARLSHPGVVTVFDVGEQDGAPWFAMEFVDGATLQDLLDELREAGAGPETLFGTGPHDDGVAATCRLVADLADALHHAHERGVIHRDVKPANVLLDGVRPRLFDFGLARVVEEATMTQVGDVAGTPRYVAPEVLARGGSACSVASDLWSLGVTLFELLTLERPPPSVSSDGLAAGALTARRAAVPREVDVVCRELLTVAPDERPATAADVARRLRAAVAEPAPTPLDEHDVTLSPRTIVGLVAAVLVLAVAMWLADDPAPPGDPGRGWHGVAAQIDAGRPRRALALASQLWAEHGTGADADALVEGLIVTARAYNRLGRHDLARPLAASALATARSRHGDGSDVVARALVEFGSSLVEQSYGATSAAETAAPLVDGALDAWLDETR